MKMTLILIVDDVLETVLKGLQKILGKLEIRGRTGTIQTTTVLNQLKYLEEYWRLEKTCCHTEFSEKPQVTSSSYRAACTDNLDPLSPLLPIVHRPRQVFKATSRILTELLYVCSSWSSRFCLAIRGGP